MYTDPTLDLYVECCMAQTGFLVTKQQLGERGSFKKKPGGRFLEVKRKTRELRFTVRMKTELFNEVIEMVTGMSVMQRCQ